MLDRHKRPFDTPMRIAAIGEPKIDPWRNEMLHSLFVGAARYKVQQQTHETRKRKITLATHCNQF